MAEKDKNRDFESLGNTDISSSPIPKTQQSVDNNSADTQGMVLNTLADAIWAGKLLTAQTQILKDLEELTSSAISDLKKAINLKGAIKNSETCLSRLKQILENIQQVYKLLHDCEYLVIPKTKDFFTKEKSDIDLAKEGMEENFLMLERSIDRFKQLPYSQISDAVAEILEILKDIEDYSDLLLDSFKQIARNIFKEEISEERLFELLEAFEQTSEEIPPESIPPESIQAEQNIQPEPTKAKNEPLADEKPAAPVLKVVKKSPEKSIEQLAEELKSEAYRIKQLAVAEISKYLETLADINESERSSVKTNLILDLPDAYLRDGDRSMDRNDFNKAAIKYQKYVELMIDIVNNYAKKRLEHSYNDLYQKTKEIKYYKDGTEFDKDAVKAPSLSPRHCQEVDDKLSRLYREDVSEKVACGILEIIRLHNQEQYQSGNDYYRPSPFMHSLHDALCDELFSYYRGLGEVDTAYQKKGLIDAEHLTFYSTLNTELDKLGIDFFYVIDGAVFADGQSRVFFVDITLDSLLHKRQKRMIAHNKDKTAALLSMHQIEQSGQFREGETQFLVAACNADFGNPLDCKKPKDHLEYELTRASESSEMLNDMIIDLADIAAKEIVRELSDMEASESGYGRLDPTLDQVKRKAANAGFYEGKARKTG